MLKTIIICQFLLLSCYSFAKESKEEITQAIIKNIESSKDFRVTLFSRYEDYSTENRIIKWKEFYFDEKRSNSYKQAILMATPLSVYLPPEANGLEMGFCGYLKIDIDGQKIDIGIGGGIFFWEKSTNIKNAFISNPLMELIVEDMKKSDKELIQQEATFLKRCIRDWGKLKKQDKTIQANP